MTVNIRQKIKPKISPYAFSISAVSTIKPKLINDILSWAEESFGTPDRDNGWLFRDNSWHTSHEISIYFDDEENAAAFKLRWM